MKRKIGVITGGPGLEAEVARSSANAISKAIEVHFGDVDVIELDRDLPRRLLNTSYDVIYPTAHGSPGEDGTLQGLLELVGVPYVGSGVLASALAMNKYAAKCIYRANALPVAADRVITKLNFNESLATTIETLGSDLVVKPISQGSAIGVKFVHDAASLRRAVEVVLQLDSAALVEKRIDGIEITAAVLDLEVATGLPVIEIETPKGSWYDYEHRYTAGLSTHIIPARISGDLCRDIQAIAVQAHNALGCRDLSRSDLIVTKDGSIVLLETNTLPGMTPTSLYPDAAKYAGMAFDVLIQRLVLKALDRPRLF